MKRRSENRNETGVSANAKSDELSMAAHTSATSITTLPDAPKIQTHGSTPLPFGSLAEALGYVIFLIVFVLATAVVEPQQQAFYFANRLRTAFVEQMFTLTTGTNIGGDSVVSTSQKSFTAIQDQADMWAFLCGPFADVVYGPADENSSYDDTQGMVMSYNRLLGGVRLRTLRVKPDTCPVLSQISEYSSITSYCYGAFSRDNEQTDGYGLILNSDDIVASVCYAFAENFFAEIASAKTYANLLTCYSDCERTCGEYFGVEKFRYTSDCSSQCGIHCKCIYEEPAGYHRCVDPNPNGKDADIPTAVYSYNWSSADSLTELSVDGYTSSYPGSGYVVDLPVNGILARTTLAKLKDDRYLDLATRALVIDLTVYNAYLRLFDIVQFVIEFPATGGAFVQFTDAVLNLSRYSSANTARIVLECFLVLYVGFSWAAVGKAIYRMGGILAYVRSSVWHVITILQLSIFATVIAFRLYTINQAYGTLTGHVASVITDTKLQAIPHFQSLARIAYVDTILSSVNAGFVWLKLLQYTQMSKRMCLLLRMLHRASLDLFWFLVYFLVCICGFAQIGLMLFGFDVRGFRSLGVSILTLLQAVAGDLDYDAMLASHRVFGPLFYIAFYLLLLLILLNVFLAILNDAYLQTITEQEEADIDADEGSESETDRTDEGVMDGSENLDVDRYIDRQTRREIAQLRRYPFSKGVSYAFRLLVADIKQKIYEFRTGRKMNRTKVDPMISIIRSELETKSPSSYRGGSRKLTRQVQKQLEKEMKKGEFVRAKRQSEEQETQLIQLQSAVDKELSERLAVVVESNRQKTQRMQDMEKMLSSIENLCQQLVVDTAVLRDESSENSNGMTSYPIKAKSQSRSMIGGVGTLRSGVNSSLRFSTPPKRSTVLLKPQSLQAALPASRGGSKRKGVGEEIEEITL